MMRKPVGKDEPPDGHLPTWALMIDGRVQQVLFVPLYVKVPADPYGSVAQDVLGKHEYYDKCVEKWLLKREKFLRSARKTFRCKQELDKIYMCLGGIQESRSSRRVVRQILSKSHGALGKRSRLKKAHACRKNKAQDSSNKGDTMETSTEKETSSSKGQDMKPDGVISLVQEIKEADSIVTEKETMSKWHDMKPTNSDGENGNPKALQLITSVLASNEIHVKDECNVIEDPKESIQESKTPKPSLQMDTELPATTDINSVNVDLNRHHNNNSDSHNVSGQSITKSPTVKPESMSAEVESGETLKVLITELSCLPAATSQIENMNEEFVVDTRGHVEDTASSGTSPQQDKGLSMVAEMSSEQDVNDLHQKHQNATKEVSELLKDETLEDQLALFKTEPSTSLTIPSEDECVKNSSLRGPKGGVEGSESSMASPKNYKGHNVTAELGSDLEVHEEHHKKDTKDPELSHFTTPLIREHVVVEIKGGKNILDTLSKDAHHLREDDFEPSQICHEDEKNSSNDCHDVTESGKSQSDEVTVILADTVLPVLETVSHGALGKKRRRMRRKKAHAGSNKKAQDSTNKGDTVEASTEKEMCSSKGNDGEISLVQEVKEAGSIMTEKQSMSQLPAPMEGERNEDRPTEVCVREASQDHQETLNTGGESEITKDLISELLKPTDCEGEGKEAKLEGLQLQMDTEPSCSIATPPKTNFLASNKDTMEKDAVFAEKVTEGKTSEAFINKELHVKVSKPQDKPANETHETNIIAKLKQGHDQGKVLRGHRKQITSSVPQKKAINSTKKPSQKVQRKEEKRRRKANLDCPREPCEKEKMVISAVKEIWQAYDLGQGPKNLVKLPAPCPSERYMKDHGQHIATSIKEDYLKYLFHLSWMILQETYPKPSESQSTDSKTNTNRSKNISKIKHFSLRADFQDTIIREVVKQCGLQKQSQINQQVPARLVDEIEFIHVKVTERMFENALKKSNEKRYLVWKRHTSPPTEGTKYDINVGEHSKSDSALLTTTTLAGNVLDKDGHHLKPTNSDGRNGKLISGVLSSNEIHVKNEYSVMEDPKVGIQDKETPKPSLQMDTELPPTTDINSAKVDLNQHHKNSSDSHDVSGQSITNSPSVKPESMSADVESGETLNIELSSSPAAADENMNKEHMDTRGHVEDTASSGSSPQQDKGLSVTAELSSDQDVKNQHQTHQDTTNATKEVSELLKEEMLEDKLALFRTKLSAFLTIPSEDECAKDISLNGTKGGVKDNESSVASPQNDKGHDVTAELGTDLEVHEEHHKKDTEESEHVSVVLKEEKLEIQQVSLKTELSPLTTPESKDKRLNTFPVMGTERPTVNTATSLPSAQQEDGKSVTAEIGSDQEISVEDQSLMKQWTENATEEVSALLEPTEIHAKEELVREHIVVEIEVGKSTLDTLGVDPLTPLPQKAAHHLREEDFEPSQVCHEDEKNNSNDCHDVTESVSECPGEDKGKSQSEEATVILADTVLPVLETVPHGALGKKRRRMRRKKAHAGSNKKAQDSTNKGDTVEASPEKEMSSSKGNDGEISQVQEVKEAGSIMTEKQSMSQLPAPMEGEKNEDRPTEVCVREVRNQFQGTLEQNTDGESEIAKDLISEMLQPTDCEGEGKEAKLEGLQLQMDTEPSCSIATPPTTNFMSGNKDTMEKDAVIAEKATEGKVSEAFINKELHVKVSKPQDKPADETHETNIIAKLKQGHDQGKVLRGHRKHITSSVPQKKAINSTKKPSQKVQRKEEKRRRKANLDCPREPCEKEKMVISAVKEIWQAYDLGQGPKNLFELPAPCPSERYLKDHGQHIATSIKEDYLKYLFHLSWMILQETYPKPSESQSTDSKTNTNRSKNISKIKHFSFRADFQETIIREVVKQCGLQKQSQINQQVPARLVDEIEFIHVKVTERMFENALKKSNEKRYLVWKHHTSPPTEGKKYGINVGEHNKGDSALLTTTTLAGNVLDKDGHHLKPTNSDGRNGKLISGVLSSNEIHVKNECSVMEDLKVGIQDKEMPKPSLQMDTGLLPTTDVYSVNVNLNQHHKNISDSHDVSGQSITNSPSVKPESMSADVKSGETLNILNTELSSSPAAADENMNKEHVDTRGHVEDTASSGTSPQQDKGLSVTAELSSDQDVTDQHQTHQGTTNATKKVSELLKEETLEAQLASKDESAKDISLNGTKGGVKDNESSVATPQRDKGRAVTAELGTDFEVHEEHQKKDTEESERVSVVLKEKTPDDHIGEKSVVRFSQQPQDNISSEEFGSVVTPNQQCAERSDSKKMSKGQKWSFSQKKAVPMEKQQNHKKIHKEEKRGHKSVMDSPQHLSDKEEMVLSALKVIWDAYDLGQGPKNLSQLTAPCPSQHYLELHSQHLKTIHKNDYLKYVFHYTWRILQEVYPRQPKMQSSTRYNNSAKQIPFSGTAHFHDNITKAVLKHCGLSKKKQELLQTQSCLLDEQQFLGLRLTENGFEQMKNE